MLAGLMIWTLVASIVTVIFYAWDKRSAMDQRPRVSERTLLTLSLLGGWPGGLVAGRLIRHKTQKISYRIKFAICSVLNVVLMAALLMAMR